MVVRVVILLGGPQKGTRLRPLTFDVPKPLLDFGGKSLLELQISQFSNLKSQPECIYLIGNYDNMNDEIKSVACDLSSKYKIKIKYLTETKWMGSAGCLYEFRDDLTSSEQSNDDVLLVINCDIICDMDYGNLIECHTLLRSKSNDPHVIVSKKAPNVNHVFHGSLIVDDATDKDPFPLIKHYVEKPERSISDLINCGIALFSTNALFTHLESIYKKRLQSSIENPNQMDLGKDLYPHILEQSKLFAYFLSTDHSWIAVKSVCSALHANSLILNSSLYSKSSSKPHENGDNSKSVKGNVYIHPSAKIGPSCLIGPDVSIGENVQIGKGCRISNSIILKGVIIKDRVYVKNCVIGWDSVLDSWARVEGFLHQTYTEYMSFKQSDSLFSVDGRLLPSACVLGRGVTVANGIHIHNSLVLPHKDISASTRNNIII